MAVKQPAAGPRAADRQQYPAAHLQKFLCQLILLLAATAAAAATTAAAAASKIVQLLNRGFIDLPCWRAPRQVNAAHPQTAAALEGHCPAARLRGTGQGRQ
jgi:hypothetical protein